MNLNRQCVQMSYYCLKHTCEDYESRCVPEWECSKLVYCIVPIKTKKFSEGRSNRDVKVRILEIEVCCPHTRVDTRPDGTISFLSEIGYQEKRIQDRKIYNWSHTSSFLGN
jgi:hypothetical protein